MTKSQATKLALERYGVGVSLTVTQGKGKYKRCQIWMNGYGLKLPRRLIAHGETWEELLT